MPAVTCPTCAGDDIDAVGRDGAGDLRLRCEACGSEWTRTPNRPCPACSSIDVSHTDADGYLCRSCGHGWRDVQVARAPEPAPKPRATRSRASSTSVARPAPRAGAAQHIERVWQQIERYGGHPFTLKSGQDFTYQVSGAVLMPSTANWDVPKSEVHEALARMPVTGPAQLKDLQAAAFLYAILTDPRITPAWH
jgi:hypothetical protein